MYPLNGICYKRFTFLSLSHIPQTFPSTSFVIQQDSVALVFPLKQFLLPFDLLLSSWKLL